MKGARPFGLAFFIPGSGTRVTGPGTRLSGSGTRVVVPDTRVIGSDRPVIGPDSRVLSPTMLGDRAPTRIGGAAAASYMSGDGMT